MVPRLGRADADDVAVLGARKKGESSWSEPFLMADHPGFPDCNTAMMVDAKGRLWLFWPTDHRQHLGIVPDELPGLVRLRAARRAEVGARGVILLKPADFRDEA